MTTNDNIDAIDARIYGHDDATVYTTRDGRVYRHNDDMDARAAWVYGTGAQGAVNH